MPLYEYECANCGSFELIRKFSDPPLKKCPRCGGKVEKRLSSPAIQFKGSGWYVTDYAGKGKAKEEKPAGAGSDTKPASEAKPAEATKPSDPAKKGGTKGKSGA